MLGEAKTMDILSTSKKSVCVVHELDAMAYRGRGKSDLSVKDSVEMRVTEGVPITIETQIVSL